MAVWLVLLLQNWHVTGLKQLENSHVTSLVLLATWLVTGFQLLENSHVTGLQQLTTWHVTGLQLHIWRVYHCLRLTCYWFTTSHMTCLPLFETDLLLVYCFTTVGDLTCDWFTTVGEFTTGWFTTWHVTGLQLLENLQLAGLQLDLWQDYNCWRIHHSLVYSLTCDKITTVGEFTTDWFTPWPVTGLQLLETDIWFAYNCWRLDLCLVYNWLRLDLCLAYNWLRLDLWLVYNLTCDWFTTVGDFTTGWFTPWPVTGLQLLETDIWFVYNCWKLDLCLAYNWLRLDLWLVYNWLRLDLWLVHNSWKLEMWLAFNCWRFDWLIPPMLYHIDGVR